MNIIIDNIASDGCFSIRKQGLDGYERRAFCPGQWNELEEYIPGYESKYPEIAEQVNRLWTPEAIAAWQQKQAVNEIA